MIGWLDDKMYLKKDRQYSITFSFVIFVYLLSLFWVFICLLWSIHVTLDKRWSPIVFVFFVLKLPMFVLLVLFIHFSVVYFCVILKNIAHCLIYLYKMIFFVLLSVMTGWWGRGWMTFHRFSVIFLPFVAVQWWPWYVEFRWCLTPSSYCLRM